MAAPSTAQTFGLKWPVFTVIGVSFIARALVAGLTELGNDEVYYLTYARFQDWSHFDHPAMVGWVIDLFTLDLKYTHEFFIRLSALVLGTANLYLIYRITDTISGHRTAFIALLLASSSIYLSVLTGLFILPDTPQVFFWLLSLSFIISVFSDKDRAQAQNLRLILGGVFMACALLSKYHAVFLPAGVFAFVLFHDRKWLKRWAFWTMLIIAACGVLPTLYWNYANDFITFSFHGNRVIPESWSINHNTLIQELVGELFYQNPIVFVAIWAALFSFRKQRKTRAVFPTNSYRLLLWVALPLLIVFISFSLFRRTLPHWTGPAYVTLIPLAAGWMQQVAKRSIPISTLVANGLLALILVLGTLQIRYGIINLDNRHHDVHNWQQDDATLDMFGWKRLRDSLKVKLPEYKENPGQRVILTSQGWFPGSHIDHYVARPNNIEFIALGQPTDIHKYWWINVEHIPVDSTDLILFINDSRNFRPPSELEKRFKSELETIDTLTINRGQRVAKHVLIHRFRGVPKVSAYPNP
jgi:hypothetical protein